MEEFPRRELNSPEIENDTERNKHAQEEVEHDLQKKLEKYEDVKYEVYEDKISAGDEHGWEIAGYPEYYSFLKEADYFCQYVLLQDADAIVVFDKSGRGFGLLANKILPILALEKAIREDKPPQDIKIPKIYFYNAVKVPGAGDKKGTEEYYSSQHWKKLSEFMNSISGDNIILFDESSNDWQPNWEGPAQRLWVNPDGSEPLRWRPTDEEATSRYHRARFWPHEKDPYGEADTSDPNVLNVRRVLTKEVPNKKFFNYVGGHGQPGGFDMGTRKTGGVPYSRGSEYNINPIHRDQQEKRLYQEIFAEPSNDYDQAYLEQNLNYPKYMETLKAFSGLDVSTLTYEEKIKIAKEHLDHYRRQIRDEQSKMAWELFQQIILHKNPYKPEKGQLET